MPNTKLKKHIENILAERYYLKNESSWGQLAARVSSIYPPMLESITNRVFIPSTPTLMNLNTKGERYGTLSSCFILEIEDSLDNIMDSMKEAAIVTKMSGGVGYEWSNLRGSNENVKSIGANSGGVLPFIQIFDSVLDGVQQGGRRRGAGMSMLSIYHPDILKFINAKTGDTTKYTRSNFSVRPDEKFYKTLLGTPDKFFKTKNITDGKENILVDEVGTQYTYKMLWDKIIHSAWEYAEPGIFNGHLAVERCTCKHITVRVFSNPCSEYVHIPNTSCNLGSINLAALVDINICNAGAAVAFNWKRFESLIEIAVDYLNEVIDNNNYPIKKIKDETLAVRPIGLGEMGLAHLFYLLGIKYDSIEGSKMARLINRFMTLIAIRRSMELAKKYGKTYKYYDYNTFMEANKRFFTEDTFMGINVVELADNIEKYGVYNSCFTSIAPTGTISYIADTSSGMEPVTGLVITRKVEKENKVYEYVYLIDPIFEQFVNKHHPDTKEKIYEYVSSHSGSCQGCPLLSKEEQALYVVAGDITPMWHLQILAAIANNVSLSVSKTINLPKDCSERDISEVYLKAQELGVIGVTVYRDGSREGILVHKDGNAFVVKKNSSPKRPKDVKGELNLFTVGKHDYYTAVGFDDVGNVFEVFTGFNEGKKDEVLSVATAGTIRKLQRGDYIFIGDNKEKFCLTNGHSDDTADALTRSISWGLRHGGGIDFAVHQLEKTRGSMLSFAKVLARTLKKYIAEGTLIHGEKCPSCGNDLKRIEGCIKCPCCGWAKC